MTTDGGEGAGRGGVAWGWVGLEGTPGPRNLGRGLGSVRPEEKQAEWGSGTQCQEPDQPRQVWLGFTCLHTHTICCPQHSVTLVPTDTFSSEFVEPRVHCISSHGAFSPSR